MTTAVIELDESSGSNERSYSFTRVVRVAGRIVRVRLKRHFFLYESHALAEALSDGMMWTDLTYEHPLSWWHSTPETYPGIPAAKVLGPMAEKLLRRATDIICPPLTVHSCCCAHSHKSKS